MQVLCRLWKEKWNLIGGLFLIAVFPFMFICDGSSGIIGDIQLIRHAAVAPGRATFEDMEQNEDHSWTYCYTYTYTLPDGSTRNGRQSFRGRRNAPPFESKKVDIEYLPGSPDVSRIAGTKSRTVWQWIRLLVFASAITICASSIGVRVICECLRTVIGKESAGD